MDGLVWLRDLDGTGSMHVCAKGDRGAVCYAPADHIEAMESLLRDMRAYIEADMLPDDIIARIDAILPPIGDE